MPPISLRHLTNIAGRGVAGYRRGQTEGTALQRALERQQLEYALRMAPLVKSQREGAALNQFLGEQPEGQDLAGRGLSPTAALGLYSGRLAAKRQQQPTPTQTHNRTRQAFLDLKAKAQADADYIARSNVNPSVLGIYAALRANRAYKDLDDATLRGVAAEAVGPKPRTGAADLQSAVQRAADALGVRKP